jgi:hypothetical protein
MILTLIKIPYEWGDKKELAVKVIYRKAIF